MDIHVVGEHGASSAPAEVLDPVDGSWVRLQGLAPEQRAAVVTSAYCSSNGELCARLPDGEPAGLVALLPTARRLEGTGVGVATAGPRWQILRHAVGSTIAPETPGEGFVLSPASSPCEFSWTDDGGGRLRWNGFEMASGRVAAVTAAFAPCRTVEQGPGHAACADVDENRVTVRWHPRGDRIRITMEYAVRHAQSRAVPVTFQLRAGRLALPRGVMHVPLSFDEHLDCMGPVDAYRDYVILSATPLGYLALEDGGFIGVFDPELSGCIFRGHADGRIEVTRWFYPETAGAKYTWCFDVLAGAEAFPAALLRATWPHTRDNRDVFGGAMGRIDDDLKPAVDAPQARRVFQEMKEAGFAWILRHNWFRHIGAYVRFECDDDEEYTGMDLVPTSRTRVRRLGAVLHEVGLKYFLYIGFANCSVTIEDRFRDACIRDGVGEPLGGGVDGHVQRRVRNTCLNPSLDLTYAKSMLEQAARICSWEEIDGIYVDGLGRASDNILQRGLWDRGHRDGSAAPLDHYENGDRDLPPAAGLALASKDYLEALAGVVHSHGKHIICNTSRSMWVAGLADAFQTEMHVNPYVMLLAQCLGNGKSMSIKGNVMHFAKDSRTTGLARNACALLTRNYPAPQSSEPYLPPFRERIDIRPQRLLSIITGEDDHTQVWLFTGARSVLRFHPEEEAYPANLDGSSVESFDPDASEIRTLSLENAAVHVGYWDGAEATFDAVDPKERDTVWAKRIRDETAFL